MDYTRRISSFILSIFSAVKIWHFNKLTEKHDWSRFFYSISNDFCHAALYFKMYVPLLNGVHFTWFPLLASVVFITLELLQYRILHNVHNILLRGRFEDNLMAPVFCSSFYAISRGVDFENAGMDEAKSFLAFLLFLFVSVMCFGSTHYLQHNIPSLYWELPRISSSWCQWWFFKGFDAKLCNKCKNQGI